MSQNLIDNTNLHIKEILNLNSYYINILNEVMNY